MNKSKKFLRFPRINICLLSCLSDILQKTVGIIERNSTICCILRDMEADRRYTSDMGCCCPISVAIGIEQEHLNGGDRATMLGIGSGLSCIMLGLEW